MRAWRKFGAVMLAIVAVWMLLALLQWLPRIPAEQREALARLRAEPPPLPGRNASIYAWLVDRGVPDEDWPRWLALAEPEAQAALEKLPAASAWPQAFAACIGGGQGCLARVAAAPDEARALRDAQAQRLRRITWVQRETSHVAAVGPRHFATPLPPLGSLHAPVRLDVALRFLDGDRHGALERLCVHAQWWRAARRSTDLVFVSMLSNSVLAGAGQSYVELVQALPAAEAPPAACAAVFAPLADAELDLCRALRGEFLTAEAMLREALAAQEDDGPLRRLARRLTYHPEATSALAAPAYDHWCGDPQRDAASAREEVRMTPPGRCGADGSLFNPGGCVLSQIAAPTLPFAYQRALDLDGRLRLVASAAWLREQAAPDAAAAFALRPPALRDARHVFDGPRCAPTLAFRARSNPGADEPWRLRLAPPADCPPEPTP